MRHSEGKAFKLQLEHVHAGASLKTETPPQEKPPPQEPEEPMFEVVGLDEGGMDDADEEDEEEEEESEEASPGLLGKRRGGVDGSKSRTKQGRTKTQREG